MAPRCRFFAGPEARALGRRRCNRADGACGVGSSRGQRPTLLAAADAIARAAHAAQVDEPYRERWWSEPFLLDDVLQRVLRLLACGAVRLLARDPNVGVGVLALRPGWGGNAGGIEYCSKHSYRSSNTAAAAFASLTVQGTKLMAVAAKGSRVENGWQ